MWNGVTYKKLSLHKRRMETLLIETFYFYIFRLCISNRPTIPFHQYYFIYLFMYYLFNVGLPWGLLPYDEGEDVPPKWVGPEISCSWKWVSFQCWFPKRGSLFHVSWKWVLVLSVILTPPAVPQVASWNILVLRVCELALSWQAGHGILKIWNQLCLRNGCGFDIKFIEMGVFFYHPHPGNGYIRKKMDGTPLSVFYTSVLCTSIQSSVVYNTNEKESM